MTTSISASQVRPDLSPEAMRESSAEAARFLKSLANEDRLMLLCQLIGTELCVGELEECVDIRQPTLSQQLAVLRSEGLVATRREGKHIYYRVSDDRVLVMLRALSALFCSKEEIKHVD